MNYRVLLIALLASIYSVFAQPKLNTNPKKDYVVTIYTKLGEINLILYDSTPLHKANFIKLASEKFYDSTSFHRIIKGFMIQGGDPNSKDADPNNDGMGGPGYTVPAEFKPKFIHNQGALAAARMGDGQNPMKASSGSQFYIVENKDGTHFLDNNYTVYGQVIKGLDVVNKIAEQPKDGRDRPTENIKMTIKVELLKKKKIKKIYGFDYETLK
jgi:cyclophilin family peptidyl-prolyl cis-trans isomerase